MCIGLITGTNAGAANLPGLTVIGVSPDGTETSLGGSDYRWLVEQDKTYHVQTLPGGAADPTTFDPNWDQLNDGLTGGETLSVGFHQSYMPVVAKGCAGTDAAWQAAAACAELPVPGGVLAPDTHYYVSVVPRSGYTIGGASFVTDGAGNIPATTVYVNAHPIETAQITILIFHDNAPINNAPDLPTEDPANDGNGDGLPDNPMDGFQILVEDAGGRYGASAGVQSQDAFGNPLGTTYDATGNVTGFAPLITGPDGRLTIKNLAPGKYGISAVPPAGMGWQQTATIEGTKVIDAWVKAGEPPYFAEFGPPGFHVFIGFVKDFDNIPEGGTTALSGTIVNQHMSRPPDYAFYNGACFGHTTPWVGLNDMAGGGIGTGIYAAPTDENCGFTIPNVPDGTYQLAVWDSNLDLIFATYGVTITGGVCSTPSGSCDLGEVPVFQWFHRSEHRVFDDINGNGEWDLGELPGAPETAFNIRWRDGTVYQGNVSDGTGAYTFDQVFPFFSWLVAEVDFARFQATGLQVVVDAGGPIGDSGGQEPPLDGLDWTFGRAINPQDQTNPPTGPGTETIDYRVEQGTVLTQGFQGFIGQTNAFLWGKRHYPDIAPGIAGNGGISGIVFYAVTRAENDPELAAAEPWEPGIPNVTVNLYESLGVDPVTGVATKGALLASTETDSWDANIPTGCKWGNDGTGPFMFSPDGTTFYEQDCWDGLRMFNQARPAVFDGGFAFGPEIDCPGGVCPDWVNPSDADPTIGYIKAGDYIVEVMPPPGYEIVKPEDKNVDFGDEYTPAPELLPAECVGPLHTVPGLLTLFPDEGIPAPFAGTDRPLCDSKLVTVSAGANAAADFHLFTEVPVAAHGLGFILDDTQNEFDPNSPNFGEKYAPPFLPITIRDFTGRVIGKTLSDQYGLYNFLAPSTITANLPQPSGMSPNMLTACMNDPGDDPNNPDPNWNQQYSTFCYTLQYMPGVTTYLDTPVVPVAAFTGPDQFPLDCEYPDGTPRIYSVDVQTNGVGGGPYIPTYSVTAGNPAGRGVFVSGEQTLTITSMGETTVQNPDYCNPAAGACPDGSDTTNKFITRDFGFGASGTVTLGDLGALSCTWGDPITCTVPADIKIGDLPAADVIGGRQLIVTRGNGQSTVAGVTVQVGLRQGATATVIGPATPQALPPLDQTIQNAINAAGDNDLIMVRPSVYNEMVVMWKPVQLQGFGEGSTVINAIKAPTDKLDTWRALVEGLIANGSVDLLNGQEVAPGNPEPTTLFTEEGAGILVLATAGGNSRFERDRNRGARIDGFTIKSADTGGGIIANGYADYLQISNNRVANNSGFYGGGVRIGHPILTDPDGFGYIDADNDFVSIHHNQVVFNGGLGGAGGGISMCTGADSYAVTENWVCGNFSTADGGGIGHIGVSGRGEMQQGSQSGPLPLIADNIVVFNETFNQGLTVSGGGIFIGGAPPLTPGGLSPGAGSVQVLSNLIQGNSAGAGDGGGLRLTAVNGLDVANNPNNDPPNNQNDPPQWYAVDIFNNMIVDNVAGLAGGGISLQDAVAVKIQDNTIANNDSLATAGEAFSPGSPNQSTPQPGAGIASRAHSTQLAAASGNIGTFSADPTLSGAGTTAFSQNIVWQNRQFFFWVDAASGCTPGDPACLSTYGICPDPSGALACPGGNALVFDDLAVIGTVGALAGTDNLLTPGGWTGPTDPSSLFVSEYFNGARGAVAQPEVVTAIQAPAAFDEGGNFVRPGYGPLSLYDDAAPNDGLPGSLFGDYHIISGSPAAGAAASGLAEDYDGEQRPQGAFDIGADEIAE
ncbi:hypothetical protein DSCOOX_58400 [Desulfosarcina ovata subsp. ovata]|uniref:SD-repeat containing protein B domain-containing protein n=1 Tax=Desulfosarcina ovata subsp. ovata TaxID=2752305 RepID=A0A5K8ALI4_9BACT|nr:hypothetical protein DSCOOX_58400 [Desulfosarcina ovata subsp. ovata]